MKVVKRTVERKFELVVKNVKFTQKYDEEKGRYAQHINVYGDDAKKVMDLQLNTGFVQKLHPIVEKNENGENITVGVSFNTHSPTNRLENVRVEDDEFKLDTEFGTYIGSAGLNTYEFEVTEQEDPTTGEMVKLKKPQKIITLKTSMLFAHQILETEFINNQLNEFLEFDEKLALQYNVE